MRRIANSESSRYKSLPIPLPSTETTTTTTTTTTKTLHTQWVGSMIALTRLRPTTRYVLSLCSANSLLRFGLLLGAKVLIVVDLLILSGHQPPS